MTAGLRRLCGLLCAILLSNVAHASLLFDGVPAAVDTLYHYLLLPVTTEQWGHPYSPIVTLRTAGEQWLLDGRPVTGDVMELGTIDAAVTHEVVRADVEPRDTFSLRFTTLPVVSLTGLFGNSYGSGLVELFEPGVPLGEGAMRARVKRRGGSTNEPGRHKRNYAIKFVDAEKNKVDRTLLGLRHDNKWILDAGQIDMARVRNRVATELWNDFSTPSYIHDMDDRALTGVRGSAVEVLLNGAYVGVYHLTEAMDRKQMKLKKYDAATGTFHGMLWKTVGWSPTTLMKDVSEVVPMETRADWDGIEVKYPDPDEVMPTQWNVIRDAVEWVATCGDDEFEAQLDSRFDLPVLIDYFLFCNLLNAHDNLGKNIYWGCYDVADNPKLTLGVWDLDATVGQNWCDLPEYYRSNDMLPTNYLGRAGYNYHTFRLFVRMASSAHLMAMIRTRYAELRDTYFTTDRLVERYSTAIDRLIDCGAAERDARRWSGDSDIAGLTIDYAAERDYIARWLTRRCEMMKEWFGYEPEDVNCDGAVNATDVAIVVNVVAGLDTEHMERADVNRDGAVNATDIAAVVNAIAVISP